MDILNNDDCNINVLYATNVAIELTKLYYERKSSSDYVSEKSIFETYKYYKEKVEKLEKGEE